MLKPKTDNKCECNCESSKANNSEKVPASLILVKIVIINSFQILNQKSLHFNFGNTSPISYDVNVDFS